MIIKVARKISIVTFLFFCFHKMSQATFFVTIPYSWKKKFYISGAIHSNNISVILILFEYFRNMYPYHRLFRNANLKYYFEMQLFVLLCSYSTQELIIFMLSLCKTLGVWYAEKSSRSMILLTSLLFSFSLFCLMIPT